jgi:hypothetical protein
MNCNSVYDHVTIPIHSKVPYVQSPKPQTE